MKKIIYLCLLLFMTGCTENKELSCDYNYKDDSMNVSINVYMSFNNNKITKLKNTINYTTDDKNLQNDIIEQYRLDNTVDGIKFSSNTNNNNVEIVQEVDYDLVSNENDDYEIMNSDVSYDEAKKSLLESKYICK